MRRAEFKPMQLGTVLKLATTALISSDRVFPFPSLTDPFKLGQSFPALSSRDGSIVALTTSQLNTVANMSVSPAGTMFHGDRDCSSAWAQDYPRQKREADDQAVKSGCCGAQEFASQL